jgi:hypothetical protein
MGTIKTTNIEPIADNGTVTLGSSGDQFTLATGAKSSFLYPAFEAYLSSSQTVTDDVNTKIQINTEVFDTDNCYDNSTNYRFTPTVAGKYFVYGGVRASNTAASKIRDVTLRIYKNGSSYRMSDWRFADNDIQRAGLSVNAIIDFNGSSDYVELFLNINDLGGTSSANSDEKATFFGAYRLGS